MHKVKWGAPTKAPAACCQALLMTSANFWVWKHCWQCDFWNVKGVISSCHLRRVCLSRGFRCRSAPSQRLSLLRHHLPQLIAPNWQGGFFPFRDTGKWNFLADVSKSSLPFGIVIWSFAWGRVTEGSGFSTGSGTAPSKEGNPHSRGPGWKTSVIISYRDPGTQWNGREFTTSKVVKWEVANTLSLEVCKWFFTCLESLKWRGI